MEMTLLFGKQIGKLDKEKVTQVLICFAKRAPELASYLDYEVV